MKRIKISIEISVPDYITENMIGAAYDNEESRLGEFLSEELQDDESISMIVLRTYENP